MKRFWESLDRDLFALGGCVLFVAAGVAFFGEYPGGRYGSPPKSGTPAEAIVLFGLACFMGGTGFVIRSIKSKKKLKKDKGA